MVRQHEEVAGQAGVRAAVPPANRERRAARAWLAAALLSASAAAAACPICLGAGQATAAQHLASAQQAVLAVPTVDADRFRVVEVVKGERPSRGTIEGGFPRFGAVSDATALASGKPLLLVREDPLPTWVILGASRAGGVGWLRQLAAGKPGAEMSDEDRRARVALVVPYLENPEPLVAEIAYGELALQAQAFPDVRR